MPLEIVTARILAGQSLSQAVDCGAGELVRLYMPPAWTPANLTFQLSPDNLIYSDLFDAFGRELLISVVPGAGMVIGLQWRALAWLKFRSGTRQSPIAQVAQRDFRLVVEKA